MSTALEKVKKLHDAGWFGPLDVQMAGLVSRMIKDADEYLLLGVALASRAIRDGHACVDLAEYAGRSWAAILAESLAAAGAGEEAGEGEGESGRSSENYGELPGLDVWKKSLDKRIVEQGAEAGKDRKLFVLRGSKLYLRRYWDYERKVEAALVSRNVPGGVDIDEGKLGKYFSGSNPEQADAARKALKLRLALLSGGPGTGKTYTVARIVALLAESRANAAGGFKVHIAAPTGKAAVRMVESIKDAKAKMRKEQVPAAILDAIPEVATTIHRLLESQYHSPYFKRDSKNPLAADMVIIDEASMVDLPLMAKLLDALPQKCSLMLVGDVDQLASVEPGRVYGDVCQAAGGGGRLAGCLTQLTTSWRFPDSSDIGSASKLINDGSAEAWAVVQAARVGTHLEVLDSEKPATCARFRALVENKLADFLKASEPEAVLKAANQFRILCALRKGPCGVGQMNRLVEKILSGKGLKPKGTFYDHQVIMISVNTPALNLYNGDVGVVLDDHEEGAGARDLVAWFGDKDKGVRRVPVNLLPEHETAFAMTVHKAQGSEFPDVALILPDDASCPVLTRELLYTGITRVRINAKDGTGRLSLWCSKASFLKAVATRTTRATGLFAES